MAASDIYSNINNRSYLVNKIYVYVTECDEMEK